MLSNSWSSHCPSCYQPLLPCGRCDHGFFDSFVGRVCRGIVVWMDFFSCNGRWWSWCVGTEGIDGIGWLCHRPEGLLSSRTTFHRGWRIVFYNTVTSKFCTGEATGTGPVPPGPDRPFLDPPKNPIVGWSHLLDLPKNPGLGWSHLLDLSKNPGLWGLLWIEKANI